MRHCRSFVVPAWLYLWSHFFKWTLTFPLKRKGMGAALFMSFCTWAKTTHFHITTILCSDVDEVLNSFWMKGWPTWAEYLAPGFFTVFLDLAFHRAESWALITIWSRVPRRATMRTHVRISYFLLHFLSIPSPTFLPFCLASNMQLL